MQSMLPAMPSGCGEPGRHQLTGLGHTVRTRPQPPKHRAGEALQTGVHCSGCTEGEQRLGR